LLLFLSPALLSVERFTRPSAHSSNTLLLSSNLPVRSLVLSSSPLSLHPAGVAALFPSAPMNGGAAETKSRPQNNPADPSLARKQCRPSPLPSSALHPGPASPPPAPLLPPSPVSPPVARTRRNPRSLPAAHRAFTSESQRLPLSEEGSSGTLARTSRTRGPSRTLPARRRLTTRRFTTQSLSRWKTKTTMVHFLPLF
jgi:hypothetical protein